MSTKELSKDELRNRIGSEKFKKFLVFLKVAGINDSDIEDPLKAGQLLDYYERNKSAIEKVDPKRSEEYGRVDTANLDQFEEHIMFEEYYEEETTTSTNATNHASTGVKRSQSNDDSNMFADYYEDEEDLSEHIIDETPVLPPRTQQSLNQPKFPLPPKPVIVLEKVDNKLLERQISRPVRPAPPPPTSRSTPPCPSSPVIYANSRENMLKSIRDRKKGYLKPVDNERSPNIQKGERRSLATLLNGALKQIHDVNIVYGEEPEVNSYWDEEWPSMPDAIPTLDYSPILNRY